ncbi:hypothetical protein ACNSOL_12445 (plasmid) [Aliarcobacter lanthieri]|uniref:hypothetical protein n=1 Tax=Aliarcobacter lanthieri TaxID=1355374 RepID=UPI003AAE45F6
MATRITKDTNLQIGTIVKGVKDFKTFTKGNIYHIFDGDCIGELFLSGNPETRLTHEEMTDNFEVVSSVDDIEDLKNKAFKLKEIFLQLKKQSKFFDSIEVSRDILIQDTINFLVEDEVFKGDEVELQFICDNMDIEMVEQCSCCGKILLPDDECYSDELNSDDVALCDQCSVFNEDTNMYEKAVHQDVIEKITGLKFSPHIGNIGSKVEEFNYWLREINFKEFGFENITDSKDYLLEFIQERTEWNICDCCGLVEVSTDLIWDSDEVYDEDYQNFRFLRATSIPSDAFCIGCLDLAGQIAKPDLETIKNRKKENNLIFRVGEFVLLENVDWDDKPRTNNFIAKIVSLDENKKTYTLEGYDDAEFKEEEFYDVLNEAYLLKYADFIADEYDNLSSEVDDWVSPNGEGIADIDYAFKNFGYKDEFIKYLKARDLPYGRFLEPKYKIGDKFKVHFDYYEENEFTEHIISNIDTSFKEADEIVYWSKEGVYTTESELEKQNILKEVYGDNTKENTPSKGNPNISVKISELTKMGENRIEFLSQLEDLDIGCFEDENAEDIKNPFKHLNLDEKIYYLQAIIEDLEDYKKL